MATDIKQQALEKHYECKSRNFTWRNKIIRIFAANIYNI